MAERRREKRERVACEYCLMILVVLYAIFGVGIVTYGLVQDYEGERAGVGQIMVALGVQKQTHLYYATGAFSIFTSIAFTIALCLTPKWGIWYIMGCVFLMVTMALNIYLVCSLLISNKYGYGARNYLATLSLTSPEGKALWDNLQSYYSCCGIMDEDEWQDKPSSCPSFPEDDEELHGCAPKFAQVHKQKAIGTLIVLFVIIILEVLGLIAVYCILWPYFLEERRQEEEGTQEEEEEGEEEGEEGEEEA